MEKETTKVDLSGQFPTHADLRAQLSRAMLVWMYKQGLKIRMVPVQISFEYTCDV